MLNFLEHALAPPRCKTTSYIVAVKSIFGCPCDCSNNRRDTKACFL